MYAAGVSEEIVGRWLAVRPARKRDSVVLATKSRFQLGSYINDVGLSRRHLQQIVRTLSSAKVLEAADSPVVT